MQEEIEVICMKRHALTDEQWQIIEPLVPKSQARTGRPARDSRLMLDGIFRILEPVRHGVICRNALALGRRSTTIFASGGRVVFLRASSRHYR